MYAALVAAIIVVSLIREGAHSDLVIGGAILVVTTAGFLLGLWPAWLSLVTVHAGSALLIVLRWPAWWTVLNSVLVNLALLALLLSRHSRRHARRWRPRLPRRFGRRLT